MRKLIIASLTAAVLAVLSACGHSAAKPTAAAPVPTTAAPTTTPAPTSTPAPSKVAPVKVADMRIGATLTIPAKPGYGRITVTPSKVERFAEGTDKYTGIYVRQCYAAGTKKFETSYDSFSLAMSDDTVSTSYLSTGPRDELAYPTVAIAPGTSRCVAGWLSFATPTGTAVSLTRSTSDGDFTWRVSA